MAQTVISVTDSSQVGEARRAAVRLAEAGGFSETQKGEVAIVVTELANNLARYGRNGKLLLQTIAPAMGNSFEILAIDSGPGMADVQRCMQDGFSSGGTPGTGLGAVRRLATEFDLYSAPGSGTVVLARVGAKPRATFQRPQPFQWGAVSVCAPNETVCGDAWRVIEQEGQVCVMIADGLGHGPLAAEASEQAARVFEQTAFAAGPKAFIENAHREISGTRGAAIAAATASLATKAIRYAGAGNISGSIVSASESRGLFSHNGTVGHQMRKLQELDYPWPVGSLLIMFSDGLQSRWNLAEYPGLLIRHPSIVAAVLYRDFLRGRDDATVVIVRLVKA